MDKKTTTISISSDVLEAFQKKYPMKMSSMIEDYLRSMLADSPKERALTAIEAEMKALKDTYDRYNLLQVERAKIKARIAQDDASVMKGKAEKALEQEERYPVCGICGASKDRKLFIKLNPNLCKNCYREADSDRIRSFLNLAKEDDDA